MEISSGQVERSLVTVANRLSSILDTTAPAVIEMAKAGLQQSKTEFSRVRPKGGADHAARSWGYSIHHSDPLRFVPTEVDGLRLRVDMFLKSYWNSDPALNPSELNVVIRVWCLDEDLYFRSDWDAEALSGEIDPHYGRVMLRFHFDLANRGQVGPRYHLQVGGNSPPDEHHWFPKSLSVPRFVHTPVDLILATELIAATFYPSRYRDIRREPSWVGSRKDSQKHLLDEYFDLGRAAVADGGSVLESLWNVPWQ